jgi:exosortase/archaeosortase family protein
MAEARTKTTQLNRLITIALLTVAFWPVFVWYAARTFDKSDQPWGLLALLTALIIIVVSVREKNKIAETLSEPQNAATNDNKFWAGITAVSIYMISYSVAPPLVQSILLVLAIWFLLISEIPGPSKPGLLGLLLLSLPLIPSLNFFLGYPLRIVVAEGTRIMLNNLGLDAAREGVMLLVNGQLSAIDAPCSGVSMLWAETYVVMVLACKFRFNLQRTSLLTVASILAIVLGNILRASTLIVFDRIAAADSVHNLAQFEPSIHLGAGLLCFSAVCGTTIMLASFLADRLSLQPKRNQRNRFKALRLPKVEFNAWQLPFPKNLAGQFLIPFCIAAALMPVISHPIASMPTTESPANWPAEINGHKIIPVDSLAEERAFASDFPGQMKRFTDGTNSYFVRFVTQETRQLHPSSDCFKGLGYEIETHPIVVSPENIKWGAFEAVKAKSRYLILERIYDSSGHSSTDVSEWYWLAALGKTHGPWFDITIAQPLPSLSLPKQ